VDEVVSYIYQVMEPAEEYCLMMIISCCSLCSFYIKRVHFLFKDAPLICTQLSLLFSAISPLF